MALECGEYSETKKKLNMAARSLRSHTLELDSKIVVVNMLNKESSFDQITAKLGRRDLRLVHMLQLICPTSGPNVLMRNRCGSGILDESGGCHTKLDSFREVDPNSVVFEAHVHAWNSEQMGPLLRLVISGMWIKDVATGSGEFSVVIVGFLSVYPITDLCDPGHDAGGYCWMVWNKFGGLIYRGAVFDTGVCHSLDTKSENKVNWEYTASMLMYRGCGMWSGHFGDWGGLKEDSRSMIQQKRPPKYSLPVDKMHDAAIQSQRPEEKIVPTLSLFLEKSIGRANIIRSVSLSQIVPLQERSSTISKIEKFLQKRKTKLSGDKQETTFNKMELAIFINKRGLPKLLYQVSAKCTNGTGFQSHAKRDLSQSLNLRQ